MNRAEERLRPERSGIFFVALLLEPGGVSIQYSVVWVRCVGQDVAVV
jgi:hypothetical protein